MYASIGTLGICILLEVLMALCCILAEPLQQGSHLMNGCGVTLAVLLTAALWACRCFSQKAMPAYTVLVLALTQSVSAGLSIEEQLVVRPPDFACLPVVFMTILPTVANLVVYILCQIPAFPRHHVAVLLAVKAAAGSSAILHLLSFAPLAGVPVLITCAAALVLGLPFCLFICEPILIVSVRVLAKLEAVAAGLPAAAVQAQEAAGPPATAGQAPAAAGQAQAAEGLHGYLLRLLDGGLIAGEARSNPILASCAAAGWLSSSPSAPLSLLRLSLCTPATCADWYPGLAALARHRLHTQYYIVMATSCRLGRPRGREPGRLRHLPHECSQKHPLALLLQGSPLGTSDCGACWPAARPAAL